MLLKEESIDNLKIVVEAVQTSVDQVYEAYSNLTKALDPSGVTELISFVDLEDKNNAPLFQVKAGKVHRRSNINNLNDTRTTHNWWGLTTLVKISLCCYRHIIIDTVTVREKVIVLYIDRQIIY